MCEQNKCPLNGINLRDCPKIEVSKPYGTPVPIHPKVVNEIEDFKFTVMISTIFGIGIGLLIAALT